MRIVDVSHWGFLLEHESMPFFIPVNKFPIPTNSKVQLKEDLVVVVKSTDLPFFFDRDGEAHILDEESAYTPLIKSAMVNHVMAQNR